MDFLLECIGFPPGMREGGLVERILAEGEGAPWRGDPERHLRVPLGAGLEVRADREPGESFWTVLPHFRSPFRVRVALETLRRVPDSPYDLLVTGWVGPPIEDDSHDPWLPRGAPGLYRISTWLTDARRLAQRLPEPGHVLALGLAGFAVDVEAIVPNAKARDPRILERPAGAYVLPLEGPDAPGGCCSVSLRIRSVQRLQNPWTGEAVALLECDAPERPLVLFLSRWQLAQDGLSEPRPGWRVEGTFHLTGRIEGGAPRPWRSAGRAFG